MDLSLMMFRKPCFLSAKEKEIIANLFASIATELNNNIDSFSQDVLVSQIELLLNYSNRFYNRQFIHYKSFRLGNCLWLGF